MTSLQCSVTSCMSNSKNMCCLPYIKVAGERATDQDDTCCASFSPKQSSTTNLKYDIPEASTDIRCNVEQCTYNEQHKCAKDNVSVEGYDASEKTDTLCASFKQ